MRASLLSALIACLSFACGAPQGGEATPSQSPCEALITQYRDTLRSADGACESDGDCVLYGGVDPNAICGGVTDTGTGSRLAEISAAMDEASCPRAGYSCPAIEARCVERVCR